MASGSQESLDFRPTHIVLGPGGARGFYQVGALHRLWTTGYLDKVVGYSGASVGALISLLMTCGYTPSEIVTMASETNLFTEFSSVELSAKLPEMKKKCGIISNDVIRKKLEVAMMTKFTRSLNMHELYMVTGIELVIVTYDKTARCPVYISYKTLPETNAITAVLWSINIPLLFYRNDYNGHELIDGGFCDPLPIFPFDNGKNRVLAIYINTRIGTSNDGSFIGDVTSNVHHILMTSIHQLRDIIIATSSPLCDFIELESHIVDTTGVTLTSKQKAEMIMRGVHTVNAYFKRIEDRIKDPASHQVFGLSSILLKILVSQNDRRIIRFGRH
jgi:predicted acylesterase/phospholipase RssA